MTNKKPTALIIGSHGMLGSELLKQAKKYTDWDVVTSDVSDEGGIDITDENSVKKWFEKAKPDIVINCAAYTNVDGCETKEGFEIAKKVNGYGPGILAKHSAENGALYIHISSDYVFVDDKEQGYKEDYDKFKPVNKYGESKLLGEKEVMKAAGGVDSEDKSKFKNQNALLYIVRPSWLFGEGAQNFLAKIIELSEKMDTLKVVTDEVSCPTYVKDLAQRLIYIAEKKPEPGIYHAAGRGEASRYDFARKIIQVLGKKNRIEPTTLAEFGRTTGIAHYSVLLNTKLPVMRKWEEMVEDFLT
ncbi:sugar nucleotide-binding protein [Candidatus Dojkabacteria bacterium]|nr:sugar nucleotide-binding protein [Candidatus Dojkabacteria bacterium]